MNTPVASLKTSTKGHIPELDGLRGLAILMVVAHHISGEFECHSALSKSLRNVVYGGWTGVDLFFVLSGFLITGILWDTRSGEHYFRNFYARRALRIFPLYYLTLLLLFIVPPAAPLVSHFPGKLHEIFEAQVHGFSRSQPYWPFFYTYLVNVLVAWKGFGLGLYLVHFWTLSVEEHFYLIWPFVVYRLSCRGLIITAMALIVGALVLRLAMAGWINTIAILVLTPFRMDGLAVGALLALLRRLPEQRKKVARYARFVLPVAGPILFAILYSRGTESSVGRLSQNIGYSASIFFYGSLLIMALEVQWVGSIFRQRFLRFFGRYSYSIYIFHPFPQLMAIPLLALGNPNHSSIVARGRTLPLSTSLLWLDGITYILFVPVASVGIALITWHFVEAPCLRLKCYFCKQKKGSVPPFYNC